MKLGFPMLFIALSIASSAVCAQDIRAKNPKEDTCEYLVSIRFLGEYPAVCTGQGLSSNDTRMSGRVVGGSDNGASYSVIAVGDQGTILGPVTTSPGGAFTMQNLNLSHLAGVSFSLFATKNSTSTLATRLAIGKAAPASCNKDAPLFPRCGSYPGAIIFPITGKYDQWTDNRAVVAILSKLPSSSSYEIFPRLSDRSSFLRHIRALNETSSLAFGYASIHGEPLMEQVELIVTNNPDNVGYHTAYTYPVKQTINKP